ncbi:MAG: hypothetical protein SF069_10840 [Phycisphaerae bacterium]|nr:hypothetical protein [Phycisphaerae bacterium]
MRNFLRNSVVQAALGACCTAVASAQVLTPTVGFNSNAGTRPINDPATSQEMFRTPQFSGTTASFIEANTAGQFDNNGAFRAAGASTEGDAGMRVFFDWINPANVDGWVRLTTSDGPSLPNPALNTAGKVRFKLTNISEFFAGNIGICLGIRETGNDVPALSNGGISGGIEWVGVSEVANGIVAGANNLVDTTAAGDDVQLFPLGADMSALPAGTTVIGLGTNNTLDTVPGGDDQIRRGYTLGANNERRPIPVVYLAPSANAYDVVVDLATGDITVDGITTAAGFAGFTGDGVLSAANNRGTLEHIAIVNDALDSAVRIDFTIDELRFDSPTAYDFLAPTITSQLILGDTSINISVPFGPVDQIEVRRNGIPLPIFNVGSEVYNYTLTVPAVAANDVYTARYRSTQLNAFSALSNSVTVLPEPPAYGFSFLLDEDGDACSFPAGGGWEFVGAPTRVSIAGGDEVPQGRPLFLNSAVWQTITLDLTNANDVVGWLGGDGDVDPSPSGDYGMESIWFNNLSSATPVTREVLIDSIQALDAADNVLVTIRDFESSTLDLTQTRGQATVNNELVAENTTLGAYDGFVAKRLTWLFNAALPAQASFGQLTRSSTCGTSYRWNAANNAKIRFRMVLRAPNPNSLALPVVQGPILVGDSEVVVLNSSTATAVELFVNGVSVASQAPTGTFTIFSGVTLAAGDSVSATQTIGPDESGYAYPKAVQTTLLAPPAPGIPAPVQDGDNVVTVTGIVRLTSLIEIVDAANVVLGSSNTFNPDGTVAITLNRQLDGLENIRARVTNSGGSTLSAPFEVGRGNGDIKIALGVREGNDAGALGTQGVGTGPIEWIGASGTTSGAPNGISFVPSDNWVTLTFDPAVGPVTSFASGNGIIDVARGSIEHLAVSVDNLSPNRSTGLFELYVDNVVNVGANGGADFIVSDFESFALDAEALFQEPNFSGSTDVNLRFPPADSVVSNEEANGGLQSCKLTFFFRDTAAGRWVRITTSGADNLSRPIVDLTKPIRMDVLLRPAAPSFALGDMNCDGFITVGDIGGFVLALTNPTQYAIQFPGCDINLADINQDGFVTVGDIGAFVALLTGN